MHKNPSTQDRTIRAAALAGAAVFLFALALFAAAGSFTRFWADDYCYTAAIKELGLVRGVIDWYQASGNRLSTLAPVALSDLFGMGAVRFVPLVVMALWVAALFFFLRELSRLSGSKVRPIWTAVLALGLVYYLVLLAPDRLQTVYWRMGVFHYSLPMPLMLINLGLIVYWMRIKRATAWGCLLAGLLAFFTAGLSETAAALQVGVILTAMALVFLPAARRSFGRVDRARALLLLTPALLGSLLMMAVMSQAPANAWRQAVMPAPENPLLIAPVSLRHAADFVFYSLRGRPAAFLAFCLLVFSAGLLGFGPHRSENPPAARRTTPWVMLAGTLLSLLAAYGWIVFSFAPSAFADLQYPAGRALMPGHFALLAGLGSASFLVSRAALLAWGDRPRGVQFVLALVLFAAACLYPLRAIPISRQDAAELSARARRWDERTAEIRAAVAGGEQNVQVRQVDVVQGLEDIGPEPQFWINRCAAITFDAQSITARP